MRPAFRPLAFTAAAAVVFVLAAVAPAAADPPAWQVGVLVDGAPIQGSNGLTVGPDGHLYVASVTAREIVVLDRRSGRILDRLGTDLGVETPDDVTFGPDGSLYWTSIFTGAVGRRAPDGTTSTVAQLPPGANPIAFDASGRLFVGLAAFGDALYEVDPEGVFPPRLVLDQPGGLNGFAFGPDGRLYSPLGATASVVAIDVDTLDIETIAGGFLLPVALDIDSAGFAWVNDTAAGEIVRVDLDTGAKEVVAEVGTGTDNLAFDADDRLYLSNLLDGSVRTLLPNGRTRTVSRGGLIAPGGVAVVPFGRHGREAVVVADFFTLRTFDRRSGRQLAEARALPLFSELAPPATVAPAPGGRLLLTSWLLNAVQLFDPATETVDLSLFDFAVPINAIAFGGDLVVAELGTGSVVRAAGADPSQRTVLASGLGVPAGLAAAGGDLWATDFAAGTVLQIVAAGQVLSPPEVVSSGLAAPEGLAVLPGGDLVVVEAGAGRVTRIDPATGAPSPIAGGLDLGAPPPPLVPPSWLFGGIAAGADGALYVSGDRGPALYRLRPVGGG